MEVGKTSFDDCEALTWSFGCTLRPSRGGGQRARAPRWCSCWSWCRTRSGTRRSESPASSSPAAISVGGRGDRGGDLRSTTPSSAFTLAAAALIIASARICAGSRPRPEIGKFSTARWVCAWYSGAGRNSHLAHGVVLDAVTRVGGRADPNCCPVGSARPRTEPPLCSAMPATLSAAPERSGPAAGIADLAHSFAGAVRLRLPVAALGSARLWLPARGTMAAWQIGGTRPCATWCISMGFIVVVVLASSPCGGFGGFSFAPGGRPTPPPRPRMWSADSPGRQRSLRPAVPRKVPADWHAELVRGDRPGDHAANRGATGGRLDHAGRRVHHARRIRRAMPGQCCRRRSATADPATGQRAGRRRDLVGGPGPSGRGRLVPGDRRRRLPHHR